MCIRGRGVLTTSQTVEAALYIYLDICTLKHVCNLVTIYMSPLMYHRDLKYEA